MPEEFLDSSFSDEFATIHIPELDSESQPLLYGKRAKGQFQPASVDHISNVAKATLGEAGMHSMTARSIRGASPSKIVQLFPDLLPQALKLGRWTNSKTFVNHYQAKVSLVTSRTPPVTMKNNLQQILRWGFQPRPPDLVSALEYMLGPDHWLHRTVPNLGRIASFDGGVYSVVSGDVTKELYHYELMSAISVARGASA